MSYICLNNSLVLERRNYDRSGLVFSLYEDKGRSNFERVFEIFKELITHTSGDLDEALDWLKELDKEYKIFNAEYSYDDFSHYYCDYCQTVVLIYVTAFCVKLVGHST